MVQGKLLDEIKKEFKIAGTEDWEGQDRFANNIEAAYRVLMRNERGENRSHPN